MNADSPTVRDQVIAVLGDFDDPLRDEWAGMIADFLATAGLLRTEPRVFRAGDAEPGDVRAVMDRNGTVLVRNDGQWYILTGEGCGWSQAMHWGPLVEIVLPAVVNE